jgi:hypothetical protein
MPTNPFTGAATVLDFTAVLGSAPTGDLNGGVSLNLFPTGTVVDTYDITGTDDAGAVLSLVLTNQ